MGLVTYLLTYLFTYKLQLNSHSTEGAAVGHGHEMFYASKPTYRKHDQVHGRTSKRTKFMAAFSSLWLSSASTRSLLRSA